MPQSSDTASLLPGLPSRLAQLWRQARRSYACHPFVRLLELEGDPPRRIQIDYSLRTLIIDAAGQLGYAPSCSVEVTLPDDFPFAPPHVKPLGAIFHPNVDMDSVQIIPRWNAATTLADLVENIGRLLAFQAYDPSDPWNPVALQWVTENAGYVPTDPSANLSPDAGGNPLDRIARSGGLSLAALGDQLRKFGASLLDPIAPPTPAETTHQSRLIQSAAAVFTDADIPENLSSSAREILSVAASLPAAEARLSAFRRLLANAQAALSSHSGLRDATQHLTRHLADIDVMSPGDPPLEPRLLLKQLPTTQDVQKLLGILRGLLARAEQKFGASRAVQHALASPPPRSRPCPRRSSCCWIPSNPAAAAPSTPPAPS